MRALLHIVGLALADYRHEKLLSVCAVFGLAAVLAPLLILYGVKFGVLNTLTERMLSDPNTLEVSPIASGHYSPKDIEAFSKLADVSFVLPRTRSIAATMNLRATKDEHESSVVVSLEPTVAGDPLLARYNMPSVVLVPTEGVEEGVEEGMDENAEVAPSGLRRRPKADDANLRESGVILSYTAASKLDATSGDLLLGVVERAYAGEVSSAYVRLRVHGVLPLAAEQKETAWVPLKLLEACEDFRDGRAVPELGFKNGWTGKKRPDTPREYLSFRLYAKDLQAVARLHEHFAEIGIDTYTHAEEIELLTTLERGLNVIFSLVCLAAVVGFFFSTTSSVLAAIKRKQRTLGLLQLTGFTKESLVFFPVTQTVLTAILGTTMAILAYALAAKAINSAFAGSLQDLEQLCRLDGRHFFLAYVASVGISLAAAFWPARQSTRIEPSEVIRDV